MYTPFIYTTVVWVCANFAHPKSMKIGSYIKKIVGINILQANIITSTNSLHNKTIIFINGNETKFTQPQPSHSTHKCLPCDILNGTGQSQSTTAESQHTQVLAMWHSEWHWPNHSQPQPSHSTHKCLPCDILNGTGHSQSSLRVWL